MNAFCAKFPQTYSEVKLYLREIRIQERMKIETTAVDCSQSPYFSVGFSRPVRFDGAAAILICKSERDLGRVSKLPKGGERSWEAAGK